MTESESHSTVLAKTIDGLRVALAGLKPATPIKLIGESAVTVTTVGDLRAMAEMPGELKISNPYRLEPDGVVIVRPFVPYETKAISPILFPLER